MIQDAGGDVVAICDVGTGSSPVADVAGQWVYDAYGEVLVADHLLPFPQMHLGHKGIFIDRLDVAVVDSSGNESPRLVPFGHTICHNRNRLYSPQLGRFFQLDPNATAMALLQASVYHGKGVGALALAFSVEEMYGDGMNLYEYLQSNAFVYTDPLGLRTISVLRSVDLIASSIWGLWTQRYNHIKLSPNGTRADVGALIGQIAGAVYAAWSIGDSVNPLKNSVLAEIVEQRFTAAVTSVAGGVVGGQIGKAMGGAFEEMLGSGLGSGLTAAGSAIRGNKGAVASFTDIMLSIGRMGLDTITGPSSYMTTGVSIAAGYYSGIIEYMADSAFTW